MSPNHLNVWLHTTLVSECFEKLFIKHRNITLSLKNSAQLHLACSHDQPDCCVGGNQWLRNILPHFQSLGRSCSIWCCSPRSPFARHRFTELSSWGWPSMLIMPTAKIASLYSQSWASSELVTIPTHDAKHWDLSKGQKKKLSDMSCCHIGSKIYGFLVIRMAFSDLIFSISLKLLKLQLLQTSGPKFPETYDTVNFDLSKSTKTHQPPPTLLQGYWPQRKQHIRRWRNPLGRSHHHLGSP